MSKIPIYHSLGKFPCNKIGFYYVGEEPLTRNTEINANTTLLVNGQHPTEDDTIKCSSCGMVVNYVDVNKMGLVP